MADPKSQRIFITGGSGYIGSQIVAFAIAQGYQVHGLSRSEKSNEKLQSLGAVPVSGDLQTLDVLTREAAAADIVIHLADPQTRDFKVTEEEILRIGNEAVSALAAGIKGTEKPLVITSGSLIAAADPSGNETNESSPAWPEDKAPHQRIKAENFAFGLGVKVCSIRVAPLVYGRGGGGLSMYLRMSLMRGETWYVDGGTARTSFVHVDDAARLYLLAAQKAKDGGIFNCTDQNDVTIRQLIEALGQVAGVPARDLTRSDALATVGPFLTNFLTLEHRGSNAKAREELGWKPQEVGVLEDIGTGSYKELVNVLKAASA